MTATLAELERRVDALEVEAVGTRTFEKHIFDAIQRLDKDIILLDRKIEESDARFDARIRSLEVKVDRLEKSMTEVRSDIAQLKSAFDAFPKMIADIIRTELKR